MYFTGGNNSVPRISIFLPICIIFGIGNLILYHEKKRSERHRALKGLKEFIQIISTFILRFTRFLISNAYLASMNFKEIRGEKFASLLRSQVNFYP